MAQISNGANRPIYFSQGTIPDVSGAILDYFQQMVFAKVEKVVENYQLVENTININFRGVLIPQTARQLMMKEEGQRKWQWYTVYSDTALTLSPDEIIQYLGQNYRITQIRGYSLNGYFEYEMVQDFQAVSR